VILHAPAGSAPGPVATVQAGGAGRPFFFLHGDYSGGGFYCANLARHLGPERPFYALQPHGMDGGVLPRTIEAMAASYLEPLRAKQAKGPYLLGGFCAAGNIALALAQQLRARGEQVDLVVMLDTARPRPRVRAARALLTRLGALAGLSAEQQTIIYLRLRRYHARLTAALRLRLPHLFHPDISGSSAATTFQGQVLFHPDLSGGPLSGGPSAMTFQGQAQRPEATLPGGADIVSALVRPLAGHDGSAIGQGLAGRYAWAVGGYKPRPYRGRVALFWSSEEVPADTPDPSQGWGGVLRDLEVHFTPGTHLTSITRHTEQLAAQLRACLDRTDPAG
jgi:thioesterase domain-containing protein